MSNPSLKEQLLALSLGTPASDTPKAAKKPVKQGSHKPDKPRHAKAPQQHIVAAKKRPAWLEHALYGVELLKAHFPNCFKDLKSMSPLKIGIKQDLVKRLGNSEDIVTTDKACMINSLTYYVNSLPYHKSVMAGAMRIDLDGQETTAVTVEEAKYSLDRMQARLQKKKPVAQPQALAEEAVK